MMGKQQFFYFRLQPLANSLDAILLNYIKSCQPTSVGNELILKALRAFWLAEAYRNTAGEKQQQARRIAQKTIIALEAQAEYLRMIFEIKPAEHINQPVIFFPQGVSKSTLDLNEKSSELTPLDAIEEIDSGGL